MRKNATVFAVTCFLLAATISGKINAQNEFRIGAKAGVGIPNLQASDKNPVSSGWSSRLGPYLGIIADLHLGGKWYLQGEINYSSQGGKKNGVQTLPSSDFSDFIPPGTPGIPQYLYADYNDESKLNYLEIPIMARVDFPVGKQFSFFINAGPYAGFLLSAKNVTSGSSNVYAEYTNGQLASPLLPTEVSFDATTDIKSDIKSFNFGFQGGIGLAMNFSNKSSLLLSAGGNYGFIPIQKDPANGKNNTGAATVTLGYLFSITK